MTLANVVVRSANETQQLSDTPTFFEKVVTTALDLARYIRGAKGDNVA